MLDELFGFANRFLPTMTDEDPISNIMGRTNAFDNLPPTAGLNLVGNPMSGLGIMGTLLGGGQNRLPPGTIDESGAMGRPQMPSAPVDDEITVTGDGWKPKQPTILGAIADAYLMSKGMQPAFAMNRNARNINEAMGDYVNDPRGALKRLGLIRGQEGKVAELYNQLQDNERADRVEQRQFGTAYDKAMGRVAAMLGAVNEKNYGSMLPVIRRYAEARGLDVSGLPETYDADAIGLWRNSAVDVDDQIKIEALNQYRNARLGQMQQTINNNQSYRQERLEDYDNAEEGRNTRAATAEAGRNARSKNTSGSRYIEDKNTGERLGVVNKDGTSAKFQRNGRIYWVTMKGDGTIGNVIRSMSVEEYEKALKDK